MLLLNAQQVVVVVWLIAGAHAVSAIPPADQHPLNPAKASHHSIPSVQTPVPIDHTTLNPKLVPLTFEPFPLGSIKPSGWMKDQMCLMAEGFPGHMHEFYHLITNATWMGGDQEYSFLNEAWPYWYNGLTSLAYGIDDARLKAKMLELTDFVLEHQFEDGWLGPETEVKKRNFWGRYPLLLGFAQLVEAQPDRSERLLDSIHRFIDLMHSMLADDYQGYVLKKADEFDEQWGRSRAADMVVFLQWLHARHPRNNTKRIHDSMVYMYDKAYDWSHWYREDVFIKSDISKIKPEIAFTILPYIHGVNAGQGLKFGAVMHRITWNDTLLNSTRRGVKWTFEYHGAPSGGIYGDEELAGTSPVRGIELCSVVETIYSLSYLYQAMGDKDFADRAELAAFNALPVMMTSDWWAHQYGAQTNQPVSHELDRPPFWNFGASSLMYGIERNGPCCTVNHPQGYPKFLAASFVKLGDDGIVHALLMPAKITTTLKTGTKVIIRCDTNYPFDQILKYYITTDGPFKFSFRVPSWSQYSQFTINNTVITQNAKPDHHNGLQTLMIPAGESTILVSHTAVIRIAKRPNNSIAIYHGALLYALPVPAIYKSTQPVNFPGADSAPPNAKDWTITPLPSAKWNIAIDPSSLKLVTPSSDEPSSINNPLPNPIWTDNAPPIRISALACQLDGWNLTAPTGGYAPEPPTKENRKCVSSPFRVELQPYGALKVHMAEFPVLDLMMEREKEQEAEASDHVRGSKGQEEAEL